MRGRYAKVVGLGGLARVVVVLLAPPGRAVARAGAAADSAADETPQQVPAIVFPVGVPLVLPNDGDRPLLERLCASGEALVYAAMIRLMTRRLACL